MPLLNTRKIYKPKSYYHVYNRGARRTNIFSQPKDYWRFRSIARSALRRFSGIKILSFALMHNHYHLLIYQENIDDMTRFMKTITQRYVLFFNAKYKQSGRLFESCYKARLLEEDNDVDTCQKYILNNPVDEGYSNWQHSGLDI